MTVKLNAALTPPYKNLFVFIFLSLKVLSYWNTLQRTVILLPSNSNWPCLAFLDLFQRTERVSILINGLVELRLE